MSKLEPMEAADNDDGALGLSSLPPAVLDSVMQRLELKDRLQLACVCRQLRDYVEQASTLWRDVGLTDAGTQQLAAFWQWVQPRAGGMRRLLLAPKEQATEGNGVAVKRLPSNGGLAAGPGAQAGSPSRADLPPLETCLLQLPQLTGLVSLCLTAERRELCLGDWALPLKRLRQLQLAAQSLVLTDAGAGLSSLTCLSLTGLPPPPSGPLHLQQQQQQRGSATASLQASARCLPAGLQALHLAELQLQALPAALAACTQLQLLALHSVHRPVSGVFKAAVDLSALSRLTALTALALEDVGLRAGQLPPQLSCLSRLQRLKVQTGVEATQEEPFAQLSACSASLTSLDLSDCMLARFPSAVQYLTQLRELALAGNAFYRDLPLGLTRLTRLQHLALSERQALEWPGLPLLPQLSAVWVAADKQHHQHMAQQEGPTGRQLRRLLRERLLPLPQLQDLYCSCWPLRLLLDEWLHGPEAAWVRCVWRQPLQEWPHSSWEPEHWLEVKEESPFEQQQQLG